MISQPSEGRQVFIELLIFDNNKKKTQEKEETNPKTSLRFSIRAPKPP
jgi:hypothetical protein